MKTQKFFMLMFIIFIAVSCKKDLPLDSTDQIAGEQNNQPKKDFQHLKIAVVSDIHYMDPSLLQNNAAYGAAFQNYLLMDPKLIEYSDPIFREVMSKLNWQKPDILLIPGDLTKDGEKVSHESMAGLLHQLASNHIKVYVIPGNHDINNPEAMRYDGDNAFPVPSVNANEFASIYAEFGYNNALYRDPNSLSYICQPSRNLWILGIDDCKYYENTTFAVVSGVIKPQTMLWIQQKMAEAKHKHINVLAMMHHGIIEHYTGQAQLDPGYVTDNWQENADKLIDAGLNVMFTGHYHANDITKRLKDRKALYDIETGSLVTPPSPFRIIEAGDNFLDINTKRVTAINATFPYGLNFVAYSNLFLTGHLDGIFTYLLSNPPYSLPDTLPAFVAPRFRNALMAHYAGDERISLSERAKVLFVSQHISPEIGGAIMSFWTDLKPMDNNLRINLNAWNTNPDNMEIESMVASDQQ